MSGRRLPSLLCGPTADIYCTEIFLYVNRAGMRGWGYRAVVRLTFGKRCLRRLCFVS